MSEGTRKLIWESLFMADVRARYFALVAGRLRKHERMLALFVSILSSGSVVALLAKIQHLPLICGVVAAIASAVLATLKFDKRASVGATLSRQWMEITSEFEVVWARIDTIDDNSALRSYRILGKKHAPADELAISEFSLNTKLLNKCFEEVLLTRGVA